MPVSEKRSLIYLLPRLEEYDDCGFTNLRMLKEMMDCQYTFVFNKTEMYDHEANRGYYYDLSKKGGWLQGFPYTLVARDAVDNKWGEARRQRFASTVAPMRGGAWWPPGPLTICRKRNSLNTSA